MGKQILFITSTNLSCNPRLLKELRMALQYGYQPTVVAFNLHNWTTDKEEQLKKELNTVVFYYLETTRIDFVSWLISSLIEKICRTITPAFINNLYVNAMAVSKRTCLLLKWVKKNKGKFNLIIAHNPPAFYPAYKISQSINSPFAIDIEDYHPGEENSIAEKKSVSVLLKKILPKTAYTSYASPLIKLYTEQLLTEVDKPQGLVINNAFYKTEFVKPVQAPYDNNAKVKFVWFSQFIDYGRGLEKILPTLDSIAPFIELTVIGSIRNDFFIKELQQRKYIQHLPSLSQKELHIELSKHDIGLAVEDKNVDFNRTICLTNKIWAYFQSGLYIIASDTEAQKMFITAHAEHGVCTALSETVLRDTFNTVLINKVSIKLNQSRRFEYAQSFSAEPELQQLLFNWNKITNNNSSLN